jgi:hypothetical protein
LPNTRCWCSDADDDPNPNVVVVVAFLSAHNKSMLFSATAVAATGEEEEPIATAS